MTKLKNVEKVLKALSNSRRLEIVLYLRKNRESTVSNIAEAVKLSFRSTSKHLSVLRLAGLVDREQRSSEMWYFSTIETSTIANAVISKL
ncbi:MAG: metalloregulator ArsR/SmtB family transcription factor [Patescibacteria group bacterium]